MKEILINKVAVLEDGRLAVYPEIHNEGYQYIYREACGVYWDNKLKCFHSTIPQEWNYKQWYGQILSVAKGVGIRMNLSKQTVYQSKESEFKSEIIAANNDVQKWMSEQDIEQPLNEQNEIEAEKDELNRIAEEASKAFHSKKFKQVIELLTPYENSPVFSEKSVKLLKMAKKYA